jgi:hypothetical protein
MENWITIINNYSGYITTQGGESMFVPNNNFPLYYDGSAHVEFSDEITEEMEARPNEASYNKEEWRHFISANPFKMDAR